MKEDPIKHIAVILELTHSFQRALLHSMQRYMLSKPWVYHIAGPRKESTSSLMGWRPDGIIMSGHHVVPEIVAMGRRLKIPVVYLGCEYEQVMPAMVMLDNEAIGRLAAEHLMELGAQHFAFYGPVAWMSYVHRQRGMCAALQAEGHDLHTYMLALDSPLRHSWKQFDRDVVKWLKALPKPVAVLAGNDGSGRDLTLICRKANLRVPEDVVVLGVENDELSCDGASPRLSSIALPSERMGFEAAAMLDRMMDGEMPTGQPILLPPLHVVSRQSTDVIFTDRSSVTAAIHFIRENAHERIGVDEVLRHVNVNRRQLERLFRQVLGRTPHEELRRVRIEQAKRLLTETNMSMEHIAMRCGFINATRLGANFRKQTGMTPTAFRRLSRMR